MSTALAFTQVDVFTEQALLGNPLDAEVRAAIDRLVRHHCGLPDLVV